MGYKMKTIKIHKLFLAGMVSLSASSGIVLAGSHEDSGQTSSGDAQGAHAIYKNNCASCHGADHGGYLAPGPSSILGGPTGG